MRSPRDTWHSYANATYHIEQFSFRANFLRSSVEWRIVASHSVPGTVEVIGHHVEVVQVTMQLNVNKNK